MTRIHTRKEKPTNKISGIETSRKVIHRRRLRIGTGVRVTTTVTSRSIASLACGLLCSKFGVSRGR